MLLLLAAAALAASTQARVATLDNGLTVLVEEQRRTDQVALYLRVGVGSRDERDGEHGCAHLFEHLMFEGSAHVPTDAFDTWLTAAGGTNNAWTSTDETVYHMVFPAGALDLALFLESDRLGFLDAGLDADNLANQRDVVLQERAQAYGRPHGRDWDALSRVRWPEGHPYHVPVIGTVDDVRGFTLDGVEDFWRRHYRPSNAVLAVVGNVDPDHALERVRHWFGDLPDAGPPVPRAAAGHAHPATARGVLTDRVEEPTLVLAWPTIPVGHADEAPLEVVAWLLDGGRGTRLADALYYRRPLTTEVWAWSHTADLGGSFIVSATSGRVPLERLTRRVDGVLAGLVRRPPTPDELDRAREAVIAGLLDRLETPSGRAELLLECQVRTGDPNCVDDHLDRIRAVRAEDVVRVVDTWLVPQARTSLAVVPEGQADALPGATPVELP